MLKNHPWCVDHCKLDMVDHIQILQHMMPDLVHMFVQNIHITDLDNFGWLCRPKLKSSGKWSLLSFETNLLVDPHVLLIGNFKPIDKVLWPLASWLSTKVDITPTWSAWHDCSHDDWTVTLISISDENITGFVPWTGYLLGKRAITKIPRHQHII